MKTKLEPIEKIKSLGYTVTANGVLFSSCEDFKQLIDKYNQLVERVNLLSEEGNNK